MFCKEEEYRYNRHFILPEVGKPGQEKIKKSRVLMIGAGGLGCPVLQYLTAAGVGTLGIADFDRVEESNLQRQVLYGIEDVGKYKSEASAMRLKAQNPFVNFVLHKDRIDASNAMEIFSGYDIIVDGTDNFSTRYLVNDACVLTDKPLVFGSIFKFEGQVTVFNYNGSGSYRCLFPEQPLEGEVPNCSEIGVLGVLPGIIGTLQATEVLKIILGIGEVLAGKLLVMDALTLQFHTYSYKKNPSNFIIAKLKEESSYCTPENKFAMEELTAASLKALLMSGAKVQLIDVREKTEYNKKNIGGVNIPLSALRKNIDKISRENIVVVHCQTGARSRQAIRLLQEEFGFDNLKNLKEGLLGWDE